MIGISIDAEAIARVKRMVRNHLERLRDRKSFFDKVAIEAYKGVKHNFDIQGSDRQKWAPLSPLTIFVREHRASGQGKGKNTDATPLQDSRYMLSTVYPEATNDEAIVGTNCPYATLQHRGGTSSAQDVDIAPFFRNPPMPRSGRSPKRYFERMRVADKVKVRGFVMHIKPHTIPARPFMYIGVDVQTRIFEMAQRQFFNKEL